MKQKILVTGGAGFIGSHTLIELTKAGHEVVVVDNFVNSSKKSIQEVEKIIGSILKRTTYRGDSLCCVESRWRISSNPAYILRKQYNWNIDFASSYGGSPM